MNSGSSGFVTAVVDPSQMTALLQCGEFLAAVALVCMSVVILRNEDKNAPSK